MSAKATENILSITVNRETGERKVEPDSESLRRNHVIKRCPPCPRTIEILSSIPMKRATGKRKAEVLESELESESESSVHCTQLPNECPKTTEMLSSVPVNSDMTEVRSVEEELSVPCVQESKMHPKTAEVLANIPIMKQKINELESSASSKLEPTRSVEAKVEPSRIEIRREMRKIEKKKLSRGAQSGSQQSGVWISLRNKITTIKLNSINEILELKNKMPIGRLEGMFAVASDSYQSHNEIQSMLTTDGLKVVLQKDFDDYCNSLKRIVYQYKKKACEVGTSLEQEVNSVTDVAEAKVNLVKPESSEVGYRKKFLALWGIFVAFLIFVDMYVLPEDMEISPDFVYITVVFISTIFLLPILFIKRMV